MICMMGGRSQAWSHVCGTAEEGRHTALVVDATPAATVFYTTAWRSSGTLHTAGYCLVASGGGMLM